MNRLSLATAVLLACTSLTACNRDAPSAEDVATEVATEVASDIVDDVTREIREEIATDTFDLNGHDGSPAAQLTPEGDLLIDGKAVPMDAAQRQAALAYRAEISRVAEAGARLGLQGADLAKDALAQSAASLFDDKPGTIEERLQPAADKMKAEARALCETMPRLMAAQDAFAKAVPEFAPYADVDQVDIDECGEDI
jgi:hypothetical protein